MTFILELREKFYRLVAKREKLVLAAFKFVLAFLAFFFINRTVGYMEMIQRPLLLAGLSVLCAFTPTALTLFVCAVLILLNFYALALELCLIALLLFVILFCLYFRFTRGTGFYTLLTPLLCAVGCPYVVPNALGILTKPYKVISLLCGTMTYFLLKNVSENEALFRSFDDSSDTSIYTLAINQIFGNKDMIAYMAAFLAASIVVFCIRRMQTDHAWGTAILVGTAVQLVIVGGAQILMGSASKILPVILGCAVSLLLSYGFLFMVRSLDYTRVERVQFEDDEYYYYVKAVPKASVVPEEKQVKQISSKKDKNRGRKPKPANAGKRESGGMDPDVIGMTDSLTEEQKDLARRAMEEFDVDGDWLE